MSSTGDRISDTDLDDCLRKIEERTGFHFSEGEVVHTFGQTSASVTVNGVTKNITLLGKEKYVCYVTLFTHAKTSYAMDNFIVIRND